ncbi:MAG: hypothetical protein ISN64_03180 [Rickettsia sp.]|nr:hypothetical protein [Rickettsia sp.]
MLIKIQDKRKASGLKPINEEDLHFTNLCSNSLVNITYKIKEDYKDSLQVRIKTYWNTPEGKVANFEFFSSKMKPTEKMYQKNSSNTVEGNTVKATKYPAQNHIRRMKVKKLFVVCR